MRYRRVPSALFQPNSSRMIARCHFSRTNGSPAHSPFTWINMSAKNPQARSAALLSKVKRPLRAEVALRLVTLGPLAGTHLDPRSRARRHAELLLVALQNQKEVPGDRDLGELLHAADFPGIVADRVGFAVFHDERLRGAPPGPCLAVSGEGMPV